MSVKRSSLAGADFAKSGFGIQEGIIRVEDCRFKIVQRTKKDGTPVTPMHFFQIDAAVLDQNMDPKQDGVEQVDLLLCFGSKEVMENGLHKFRFRPAVVESATAEEFVDQGDEESETCEIGAEGNTFVGPEGQTPFEDSDAALFFKMLEKRGFDPKINRQAYAGNYKGMVVEVESRLKEDVCRELGVKFRANEADPNAKPTVLYPKKIHVNPAKDAAGKGGAAKGASPKSSAKPKAAEPVEEVDVEGSESTIDPKGAEVLQKIAAESKGRTIPRTKLQTLVATKAVGSMGFKPGTEFARSLKKDDVFAGIVSELGWEVSEDGKSVTFPE